MPTPDRLKRPEPYTGIDAQCEEGQIWNECCNEWQAYHEQEIRRVYTECRDEFEKIERYQAYDLPEEYICAPDVDKLINQWRTKGEK